MKHLKTSLVVLLILLISLCFFVSCRNASDYVTGSEVSIIEPSFVTTTGEEKELEVDVSVKVDGYKIKMIPLWTTDTGAPIYGSTAGKEGADKNGYVYIVASELSNIGYYTQGLWLFGLKAYCGENLIYTVQEKVVEINGNTRSIPIDPKEVEYSNASASCTVMLDDFDILLVDSLDKYNGTDYQVTVSINPVTTSGTTISEIDVTSEITSVSESKGKISKYTVPSSIAPGTYVISVIFSQKNDQGTLVVDGGTSYGFTAIPGATMIIKGTSSDDIDLYPHKFKSVGTSGSGIIIDSGSKSEVIVKAYDSSNIEITSATVGQTITFKAEIKEIIDENTSNPITSSSYKWFVDGVEQEGTSINSENLTFTPTTAKTYTITYMFLDGTNYNTISGNYYLTVTAAS